MPPNSELASLTPLQEPVADLAFLNRGMCRRHKDRDAAGVEGVWGGGV